MSMSVIAFECDKCRDGYRIVTRARPATRGGARKLPVMPQTYLVAASDRFERHSPLDHFTDLFASFALAPATAEGMRQFADNFGLPGEIGGNTRRQNLNVILREQAAMKRALAVFQNADMPGLIALLHAGHTQAGPFDIPGQSGLARVELRLDAGKLVIAVVPPSLVQAMWIQFLQVAASGAQLYRCGNCQKLFVVGTGTNRRSTAKYCSNACKVAAFKASRRPSHVPRHHSQAR
jgi:hypothetical protein